MRVRHDTHGKNKCGNGFMCQGQQNLASHLRTAMATDKHNLEETSFPEPKTQFTSASGNKRRSDSFDSHAAEGKQAFGLLMHVDQEYFLSFYIDLNLADALDNDVGK